MGKTKSIKKVTAFITRVVSEEAYLLLFKHPYAGIQLPSGTVEIGERPDAAVIREAFEETGLTSLEIVKPLGHQPHFLSEGEMAVLRMTKIFNEPSYDSSSEGLALTRGASVRIEDIEGDFCLVRTDALDSSEESEKRINNVAGYVRSSVLTNRIERYFFHLRTLNENHNPWDVSADGLVFRCFWSPLQSEMGLNPWQQPWWNDYREALIESLVSSSSSYRG